MSTTATTVHAPIDFQCQEMDFQYQEVEFADLAPMDTEFTPMKVDWLEAKTLYLTDHKLSYRDIADKYGYRSSRSRNGAHGSNGVKVALQD